MESESLPAKRQNFGCDQRVLRYELWLRCVLHDLAFFHHEGDAFGRGDVGGGVAGDGDDVGEFAFLQCADFLRDAEQLGVGVPARSASIAGMPRSTISLNSFAFWPWG
jgi:hypothetical protein